MNTEIDWGKVAGGDATERRRAVEANLPLAESWSKIICHHHRLPPSVDRGDLVAYGVIAIAGQLDKYDPSRGMSFANFASARVRGAMLDGLWEMSPVPRKASRRGAVPPEPITAAAQVERPGCEPDRDLIASDLERAVLDNVPASLRDIAGDWMGGATIAEMAERRGVGKPHVRTRINQARSFMSEALLLDGFDVPAIPLRNAIPKAPSNRGMKGRPVADSHGRVYGSVAAAARSLGYVTAKPVHLAIRLDRECGGRKWRYVMDGRRAVA